MFKTLAVAALLSPMGLPSIDDHPPSATALLPEPAVIEQLGGQTYHPTYVNQPYPQPQAQSFFGPCNRDNLIGALAGGAAGGLLGSQIGKGNGQLVAVGAGVLIGALLGQEIGSSLSAGDIACAEQAGNQAHTVPVGQQIAWNNPQTGNAGYVVPVRDGTHQVTGQYCREYQTVVYVGGRTESGYGTACYRPDGSWEIIN
ncbi:MAG: RT0821/Lpp0805 family surface protein [Pseudomonadota bacterium]